MHSSQKKSVKLKRFLSKDKYPQEFLKVISKVSSFKFPA